MEWRFKTAAEIGPSTMHAQIMALLHDEGTADSDFAAAELICVELVGNLVRHAPGKVAVRLDWAGEFPTLSVSDEENYPAPVICLPADPLAESGRGLFIVKALAKEFEVKDAASKGREACAVLPVKRRAL